MAPDPELQLDRARQALRGRRWREASHRLLDAWAACPDARLIDVLDQIDARANAPEIGAAWAARARSNDPLDVAPLCALPSPRGVHDAWTRASALLDRSRDPRIARWASRQLDERYQSALAGIWLRLIEHHGDASTPLRETYGRPGTTPAVPDALDVLPGIRALLRARAGRAPDRAVEALQAALLEDPADRDLLGLIYANPDDRDARAVYADLLSEAGDPRGEFVALGLGPGTAEALRRAKLLWNAHAAEWYAPLVGAVNLAASGHEGGFLEHAIAVREHGRDLSEAMGAACWQTVRRIALTQAPIAFVRLLVDRACRHVVEVTGLGDDHYTALGGQTLHWQRLSARITVSVTGVRDPPRFPELREVTVPGWSTVIGVRLPLWDTVEHLRVEGAHPGDVMQSVQWMPSLKKLTLRTGEPDEAAFLRADGVWRRQTP